MSRAAKAPAGVRDPLVGSSAYTRLREAAAEQEHRRVKGLVEALVFAASSPISVRDLARFAESTQVAVGAALAELIDEYRPRGLQLGKAAGGYTFRTSARYAGEVRELTGKKPVRMTRAQLETLAIVAYRQPVTRPEMDEVRGVDCGPVLRTLLERDLIRILGKREEPGRPLLYGTTENFLSFFGLESLADLPTLREFTELTDESRDTYERKLGEEPPGAPGDPAEPADPADPVTGAIRFDDEPDVLDTTSFEDDEEGEGDGGQAGAQPGAERAGLEPDEGGVGSRDADDDDLDDDDLDDLDHEDDNLAS